MEETLNKILEQLNALRNDVNGLKNGQERLEQKVDTIQASVNRIEEEQPKDVTAILNRIDKKVDGYRIDLDYLSGQQGKYDMQLNRINKLIQS